MSLYEQDDLVWCDRCHREERVGAVFHDGPYTRENSHPPTATEPPYRQPVWATRRWRIMRRLFRAMPLSEGSKYARELQEWQHAISGELDLTVEDHGRQYADLRRCVEEIQSLRHQRAVGWAAAYERGRRDEYHGNPWPPSVRPTSQNAQQDVSEGAS